MFNHGVKRRYLEANPFPGIAKVKADDELPEIFTVDELQQLFFAAPPELIPFLAQVHSRVCGRLSWYA